MSQAKIIALASSKGGVGKTSIAMALAGEATHRGLKVMLLDADLNQPLMRWGAGAHVPYAIEVVPQLELDVFDAALERAAARADLVIVDAEGSLNQILPIAIARADLTLTPLQASKLDAEEAAKAVAIVKTLRERLGLSIPHALVFSRVSAAIRDKSYGRVKAVFAAHGVPALETELVERAAFKAAFDHGATLRTLPEGAASGALKAAENAARLFEEVLALPEAERALEEAR